MSHTFSLITVTTKTTLNESRKDEIFRALKSQCGIYFEADLMHNIF